MLNFVYFNQQMGAEHIICRQSLVFAFLLIKKNKVKKKKKHKNAGQGSRTLENQLNKFFSTYASRTFSMYSQLSRSNIARGSCDSGSHQGIRQVSHFCSLIIPPLIERTLVVKVTQLNEVGLNPDPSTHRLQSSRFIHYAMTPYFLFIFS